MRFADLSPYAYYAFPLPMRNIGWLGRPDDDPSAFGRAPLSAAELARLHGASRFPASVMLGKHQCEWCPGPNPPEGTGEFHYYATDGAVYSAPVLMLHYAEAHGYRPPCMGVLPEPGALPWDGRAERLAAVLVDDALDVDLRGLAIADLRNWRDPRVVDALLRAAADPELADCAGDEIGYALAELGPAGPLPDLPEFVRWALDSALERRKAAPEGGL
ncbi:hypothetical protein ACPPVO_30510 [Dactylosporangium sp. McL0621]|uniref:DUF7919 family protein n=1 Tax=Dactylosporangium sp. McL0621 TaxID=3415678 RepID=UPI003CF70DBA